MTYWKILGLDETADLRAIKRAYATKLKTNKPDEDPEGFKALHAAYKSATLYAKHNHASETQDAATSQQAPQPDVASDEPRVMVDATLPLTAIAEDKASPDKMTLEVSDVADPEPVDCADEESEWLQGQWYDLVGNIDHVTESFHRINDLRSWSFLRERDALLDIEFKSDISHYLFSRIAATMHEHTDKMTVSKSVLDYLNGMFSWDERRDLLERQFGYEVVEQILQKTAVNAEQSLKWLSPKSHKGEMVYAGYYARLVSTIIDWSMFAFITVLLRKLDAQLFGFASSEQGFDGFVAVLLYASIVPVMEATPLQGTFGKILFGMKVVDKRGRRLNLLHAYARMLLFILSTALFKITVWINFFLKGSQLLHDRLSLSIVVRR